VLLPYFIELATLRTPAKSSKGKKSKKSAKLKSSKSNLAKKASVLSEKQDEMINIDIGPELEESAPLKSLAKRKFKPNEDLKVVQEAEVRTIEPPFKPSKEAKKP